MFNRKGSSAANEQIMELYIRLSKDTCQLIKSSYNYTIIKVPAPIGYPER